MYIPTATYKNILTWALAPKQSPFTLDSRTRVSSLVSSCDGTVCARFYIARAFFIFCSPEETIHFFAVLCCVEGTCNNAVLNLGSWSFARVRHNWRACCFQHLTPVPPLYKLTAVLVQTTRRTWNLLFRAEQNLGIAVGGQYWCFWAYTSHLAVVLVTGDPSSLIRIHANFF